MYCFLIQTMPISYFLPLLTFCSLSTFRSSLSDTTSWSSSSSSSSSSCLEPLLLVESSLLSSCASSLLLLVLTGKWRGRKGGREGGRVNRKQINTQKIDHSFVISRLDYQNRKKDSCILPPPPPSLSPVTMNQLLIYNKQEYEEEGLLKHTLHQCSWSSLSVQLRNV